VAKTTLRCAIYTRKSTEEGLDQDFNSLDAQREACIAFVQSQRHEGWKAISTHYDDGGYSGGTLDRPALQQLLTDVDAGKVDLIVVYKIDRLTRSLHDFAKIVERLDQRKASFVSITQSFNTTTSMGRLTLNVLLSFAQFEREVTGERIRDKIEASKKKGMWMGGNAPLGYESRDRKLVVNDAEAVKVRRIFERYRELGNLGSLRAKLKEENLLSKARSDKTGSRRGENDFSCGSLLAILKNRTYRGEIPHKGTYYPGQHDAIIPVELWDAVQQAIARAGDEKFSRPRIRHPLHGLITDDLKRRYSPTHTKKGGRRYHYYASRTEDDKKHPGSKKGRVPAEELEQLVAEVLERYLRDESRILDVVDRGAISVELKRAAVERAKAMTEREAGTRWVTWRTLITQIVVRLESVEVHLDGHRLQKELCPEHAEAQGDDNAPVVLTARSRLYRCGRDRPIVLGNERVAQRQPDAALLRFIARGQRWYRLLISGKRRSLRSIAEAEGVTERYVSRIVAGSLLAPDIIEQAVRGCDASTLTVKALRTRPPANWDDQRRFFGIRSPIPRADAPFEVSTPRSDGSEPGHGQSSAEHGSHLETAAPETIGSVALNGPLP
jgi:DNA invertase Pin-like site-specific DNA recombinase